MQEKLRMAAFLVTQQHRVQRVDVPAECLVGHSPAHGNGADTGSGGLLVHTAAVSLTAAGHAHAVHAVVIRHEQHYISFVLHSLHHRQDIQMAVAHQHVQPHLHQQSAVGRVHVRTARLVHGAAQQRQPLRRDSLRDGGHAGVVDAVEPQVLLIPGERHDDAAHMVVYIVVEPVAVHAPQHLLLAFQVVDLIVADHPCGLSQQCRILGQQLQDGAVAAAEGVPHHMIRLCGLPFHIPITPE